jgi:hypothetical protein
MFPAAHRSSSGVLNYICSLWFKYPYGDWSLSRLNGNNSIHQRPTTFNSKAHRKINNNKVLLKFLTPLITKRPLKIKST